MNADASVTIDVVIADMLRVLYGHRLVGSFCSRLPASTRSRL